MKIRLKELKKTTGFTIIEVMIVLAIAGLIMVIVFIAVPQLQRNQRDNARQNVVNRLKAELDTYASNNQGVYPFKSSAPHVLTGTPSFQSRYISGKVKMENPKTGIDYTLQIPGSVTDPPETHVYIYPGMKCDGEGLSGSFVAAGASNNQRQYAIRVQLDRTSTYYCVDNG